LIGPNDDVNISGSIKEADCGVFGKGDAYLDPITGATVDTQLTDFGMAELIRQGGARV